MREAGYRRREMPQRQRDEAPPRRGASLTMCPLTTAPPAWLRSPARFASTPHSTGRRAARRLPRLPHAAPPGQ